MQVDNAVIATGYSSGARGIHTVAAELAHAAASLPDFDHRNPEVAATLHHLANELAAMIGHHRTAKSQHAAGVQHWIDEVVFDRVIRPHDNRLIAPAMRSAIHQQYHTNRQSYDVATTESPVEAQRFMEPLAIDDEPVRWWES